MNKTKVLLYGYLADKYGKEFLFEGVNTTLNAIEALACNFKDFRIDILKSDYYNVWIDDDKIDSQELELPVNNKTIRIMPLLHVASGGVGKIVLGAALIGLSFISGGTLGPLVLKAGIGLMLSGFADLIFTPPEDTPDEDDSQSYLFSGAVNLSKAGLPVPVGYGRVRIGSTNISNSIYGYDSSSSGGAEDVC